MAKRTNLYYYTGGDKIFLLLLLSPPLAKAAAVLHSGGFVYLRGEGDSHLFTPKY